jgi:carbonic anhydrase/acetyltransferase-like protein (isoleucine patch superfamily)/bifunctional DNA-binding transcriptional regulator/antitoxin component of YhaV-PrlF toxin-antitoxin module
LSEAKLDAEGNLPLPPEVREALGWAPEQELLLQVEGDLLVVHPATRETSLKEEARRLVSRMRDLTLGAARQVAGTVAAMAGEGGAGGTAPHTGAFHGISPRVPETAYLAPGCTVLGDVTLGEDASVWPGVVLRGDVAPIRIGARTNIQDGAVVHVSPQVACTLGSGVTVGHQATVHACTVGDDTLIGIHAVVLDGAKIGSRCLVAAGCVVPPGMEVPDGKMVMGVPAKVVRDLTPEEIGRLHWHADSYVGLKNQYLRPAPGPASPAAGAPRKPQPPVPGMLPRYECRRAAGPIVVDGSLDDPGWAGIPAMSNLVHSNGAGPPAQDTEVKACWDDTCLYLSYACKDTDIWGNFERRDDPLYDEEVVEFFLCPTGELQHYFEFEISPLNVLFDAKVFNPDADRRTLLVDRTWDASGMRTAVRVSGKVNERASRDIGWIAEVALPFADLGLKGPPAPGTVWRANFYRIERGAATEFTAWSPTYRDPADFHVPACFGELVFVGDEL